MSDLITLGAVTGAFGVRGWLRVKSFTRPAASLVQYQNWTLVQPDRESSVEILAHQQASGGFAVQIAGITDRTEAESWRGAQIQVARDALGESEPGSFFWVDLIGLSVRNLEGVALGQVEGLLETGANDVLVVTDGESERLIPFVQGVHVREVDLDARTMLVDWHPDD